LVDEARIARRVRLALGEQLVHREA
jgi:hypothetical protein